MKFYIGIHQVNWIEKINVSFMISRARLEKRKTFPIAKVDYALDSGGFTELNKYGKWSITERQYVNIVHRIIDNVGNPTFVAPQDRMCEPFVCSKAKKSVAQHIKETVENFVKLKEMFSTNIYLLPVIQGYTLDDYLSCVDLYAAYGIDLTDYPLVGLGSICRRQKTKEGIQIIKTIAALGISLHGFGLKTTALRYVKNDIISSDSMAWSFAGRRISNPTGKTKNLANSYEYMLKWRAELEQKIDGFSM
jgi:hypothetical protein